MTTTITSPNMQLTLGIPTQDPGPEWAQLLYNAMNQNIDMHDHSNGKGVPITPLGMNISSALSFNGNNATNMGLVEFLAQGATSSVTGTLYQYGNDLYFTDGSGNIIRITQNGSVTGSSGTITGLPSGTASASFAGSAFTFQSATATPAQMNVGPLNIGAQVANPFTVTLEASPSQASNISFVLPLATPTNVSQLVQSDTSGNLGYAGFKYQVYTGTLANSGVLVFSIPSGGTAFLGLSGSYTISAGYTPIYGVPGNSTAPTGGVYFSGSSLDNKSGSSITYYVLLLYV